MHLNVNNAATAYLLFYRLHAYKRKLQHGVVALNVNCVFSVYIGYGAAFDALNRYRCSCDGLAIRRLRDRSRHHAGVARKRQQGK